MSLGKALHAPCWGGPIQRRSGHTKSGTEERLPLRSRKMVIIFFDTWCDLTRPKGFQVRVLDGFSPGSISVIACVITDSWALLPTTRPRVNILNHGSPDGLLFMKIQLLKYPVIIRLSYVWRSFLNAFRHGASVFIYEDLIFSFELEKMRLGPCIWVVNYLIGSQRFCSSGDRDPTNP